MARPTGSWDLAVAGGVLAAVALVAALVPGGSFLAVTLGIVALGLAAASLVLPRRPTRAGAVVALIAAGALGLGIVRLAPPDPATTPANLGLQGIPGTDSPGAPASTYVDAQATQGSEAAATPSEPVDPDATVVTYEIATDGMSVTHLSYVDLVDGRPVMLEELGVPPPFRHVVIVPPESVVDLTDLSVTGMGGASSRRTTCTVTVDGRTVARTSADGAYGLVTCAVPSS